MKVLKRLRPAFVATSCVAIASCTPTRTSNPPPTETNVAPVASEQPPTATADAPAKKKAGAHPVDENDHLIFRKADGTCYVQEPGKGTPPKDLMSGEKWVENKTVKCPQEFDDPAFAAIGDGMYWVKDEASGKCMQAQTFGNPPPPPKEVPCPPSLQNKK